MRQLFQGALRDDFVEEFQTGLFVEQREVAGWVVGELLELFPVWEVNRGSREVIVIVVMGERARRRCRGRRGSYRDV